MIVARVTSQFSGEKFEYRIRDWKDSGLLLPSGIKLDKIATLDKSLILKKIGSLNDTEKLEAKKILKQICDGI